MNKPERMERGLLLRTAFLAQRTGQGVDDNVSYEMGNTWQNRSDIHLGDMINAGSVFVGADSLIGPIHLAYGHAEGGYNAVYFIMGFFY